MKTPKVDIYTEKSLYREIKMLKKPTKEIVKKLYGDFGIDIYEGKKQLSILTEKQKKPNIINKIVTWFTGNAPQDYEANDSLYTVVFKYVYNNKVGLEKDIENKFGELGLKKLNSLRRMGYVDI